MRYIYLLMILIQLFIEFIYSIIGLFNSSALIWASENRSISRDSVSIWNTIYEIHMEDGKWNSKHDLFFKQIVYQLRKERVRWLFFIVKSSYIIEK